MSKEKPKRKAPSSSPAKGGAAKPAGSRLDRNQAGDAAASLMANRSGAAGGARKETALFRQLKENLNQPPIDAIGKLLDQAGNPTAKRSSQSFGPGGQQVGHNQTFGADANRTGVPRRTGG